MVYSLTGKKIDTGLYLLGKPSVQTATTVPFEITQLKTHIFNTFLLPLYSKQWDKIKENVFLLEHYKSKIQKYYQMFKLEDLLLYKELLSLFDILMEQFTQTESLEKQLYKTDTNQVIQMIYRTSRLKLKPEYELYHILLGNPRVKKENYRDDVLLDIQKQLVQENITYQKIKDYITLKYLDKES